MGLLAAPARQRIGLHRNRRRSTIEQTKMLAGIAQHPEMRGVASGFEHSGSVAAHQHGPASFKGMMVVKHELSKLTGHGTQVSSYLAMVFALVFDVEFESTHRQ